MLTEDAAQEEAQINVVLNWFEELKRLVPTNSNSLPTVRNQNPFLTRARSKDLWFYNPKSGF